MRAHCRVTEGECLACVPNERGVRGDHSRAQRLPAVWLPRRSKAPPSATTPLLLAGSRRLCGARGLHGGTPWFLLGRGSDTVTTRAASSNSGSSVSSSTTATELVDSSTDSLPVAARRNSALLAAVLVGVLLFFSGRLGVVFLAGAATSALLGVAVVPLLRRLKAAQVVRLDGPQAHLQKTGTPTMGGLFLIPAGLAVAVTFTGGAAEVLAVAAVTLACGLVGFVDDLQILLKRSSKGISGKATLAWQTLAATVFCAWVATSPPSKVSTTVPLVGDTLLICA